MIKTNAVLLCVAVSVLKSWAEVRFEQQKQRARTGVELLTTWKNRSKLLCVAVRAEDIVPKSGLSDKNHRPATLTSPMRSRVVATRSPSYVGPSTITRPS